MISQESIERVKNEASIIDVVSDTVQLRRAGMYQTGLCPFHSEKSPSFFVRDNDNSYTCFGCGAYGNVISFVMSTRAMAFPDAVEYLASRFSIELKYDKSKRSTGPSVDREKLFRVTKRAQLFFRQSLMRVKQGEGEYKAVGEYLKRRGLTAAAINAFEIGYSPVQRGSLLAVLRNEGFDDESIIMTGLARRSSSGDLFEFFRGRLVFPILIDSVRIAGFGGRVVPGVLEPEQEAQSPKYLNSPETPLYQKSRVIFGLPQAIEGVRAAKEAYFVEGYMDVVGLWMAGVRNVVACCGTALTEQHIKRFNGLASRLNLLFDGDTAGKNAAAKALLPSRNAALDLNVCFLPDDQDPDDFAKIHGEQTTQALEALPKGELIDVYIDSLLAKHGCSAQDRPGPNILGKLSDEVAKAIAPIESEVTRSALGARAARRLGIEVTILEKLEREGRRAVQAKEDKAAASVQVADAEPVSDELVGVTPAVDTLPLTDQEILRIAIVLREKIIPDILKNSEICTVLLPITIRFISQLSTSYEAFPDDEEQQKVVIKGVLKSYGPTWVSLWKDAHQRKSSGVDMDEAYKATLNNLQKNRFSRLIAERQAQGRQATSLEEELQFAEEVRQLSRRKQEVEGSRVR